MAGVFQIGIRKFITLSGIKPVTNKCLPDFFFSRHICGKAMKVEKCDKKPAPYPYKEKSYRMYNWLFDKTTARFDENTKIIVIDGPIAAGKTELAKKIAEDLGMFYMPEANLDMIYINDYGFDMRTLDCKVPESCRSFDVKDFCKDPKNPLTASFQMIQYSVRYSQYIDALAHMLSTGQGVVLDRSVYSDFVFLEAMFSQGYISKGARAAYYKVKKNTIAELLRPHLVVYLDVNVGCILERIKARCIPYETNSDVFSSKYLSTMEKVYKQQYLKNISEHSELLVYDWTSGGDVEVVIEDIERIDFDKYTKRDKKLSDWTDISTEEDWNRARQKYADDKFTMMCYLNVPCWEVPELVTEAEDVKHARDIWQEAPGEKFTWGYNAEHGDGGLLTKTVRRHRETLPLRERIVPKE